MILIIFEILTIIVNMKYKKIISNFLTIFLPLILSGVVSIFAKTNVYKSLSRPPLSPPGWVFPTIWVFLYLLMGISYYMAKKSELQDDTKIYYYVGLAFNFTWTFIFFNFRLYLLASLWIIVIIALLIKVIVDYYKIKKVAAYLQLPYLFWLLFAFYLSVGVTILN